MRTQKLAGSPPLSASTVRAALGLSQVRIAGLAGVTVTSVRIHELDPLALQNETRAKIDAVYAELRTAFVRVA